MSGPSGPAAASALLAVGALAGCGAPRPLDTDVVANPGQPSIVEAALACDADDGRWTLEVVADAWTGGAVTHWTRDAVYVERHRVSSVAAAPDGHRDELRLELAIVDDWREVVPGGSTSFTCGAAPNVLLLVEDADGGAVDCRAWGGDPAIWAEVQGLAPCG